MMDINKTNEVADQEAVRQILRVPILLTKNIRIVSGSAIFVLFVMIICWQQFDASEVSV